MLSPNYTNCGHFSGIEAKSQLFLPTNYRVTICQNEVSTGCFDVNKPGGYCMGSPNGTTTRSEGV
jgi:hypothetical protein